MYAETQSFNQDGYGEEAIKSTSMFFQQQVSAGQNVWIAAQYQRNEVDDESAFLQLGQSTKLEFHTFDTLVTQPSAWTEFPTDDEPSKKFKYASFEIELSQDVIMWQRQTYSVLDWLGDLGGLFDALRLIGWAITSPFSSYVMKMALMIKFFNPFGAKRYTGS